MTVAETPRSTVERLEVSIDVTAPPEGVWRLFTTADGLTSWWAEEAVVDPVVGGNLEARWPTMDWTMRGRYTDLIPNRVVAFTWSWDHEPENPERHVQVSIEPIAEGCAVTLTHGDYAPGDEEERQSHLDGWGHFLPRLSPAATSKDE